MGTRTRTVKRETNGKHSLHTRIHVFSTTDELYSSLDEYEMYFKNSVTILEQGLLNLEHIKYINTIANDDAHKDLKLDENTGIPFLLTREKLAEKINDEAKMKKLKLRELKVTNKSPRKKEKEIDFNVEEVKLLWLGDEEYVAGLLNKSIKQVLMQRKIYLSEHPGFPIPDICKKMRKNAKTVKETPPIKTYADLTEEEKRILWLHSGRELVKLLPANIIEINNYRKEYCKEHKDFPIPKIAKFNSKGLPNKIEGKNFWREDEEDFVWSGNESDVAECLNRPRITIHRKRLELLDKDPNFAVPLSAQFKIPKGYPNKYQTSGAQIVPLPESSIPQIVTIPEAPILYTEEIKPELREEVIKNVIQPVPPIPAPATQLPIPAAPSASTPKRSISEITELVNGVTSKPKAIIIGLDGTVKLEF